MSFRTLSEIGHRLFVEPTGTSLSSRERDLLEELKPASYLFRARNFNFRAPYDEWHDEFSSLLSDIKRCTNGIPLLLSIDHEGGRVVRPPLPVTRFPYAAKWGDQTAAVAKAMAIELRSLGLNASWAPVADVLTNPLSKAIGQRAFSSDPAVVTRRSLEMTAALEAEGVVAGGKHFPGYGPVVEDAHYDLPLAEISREDWERIHLPPFVALIDAKIKFLMTAHILYPGLDPSDQATLSKPILVDILRKDLGFEGIVVADALGMGAIRDELRHSSTVQKALNAELDLFCLAGDSVDLQTAHALGMQILEAASSGAVSEEVLIRSRNRIAVTFGSLPQHLPHRLDRAVFESHEALAIALDPSGEWKNFQYIPKGFD